MAGWSATLVLEQPIGRDVLDVMERGQSIRRRGILEGSRGGEIRARCLLHIRKNNDGTFRLSFRYGGEVIQRSQEAPEGEDADTGPGDDDDDAEDEEDREPREIITVLARFTGGASGTQAEADDTPR